MSLSQLFAKEIYIRLPDSGTGLIATKKYGWLFSRTVEFSIGRKVDAPMTPQAARLARQASPPATQTL